MKLSPDFEFRSMAVRMTILVLLAVALSANMVFAEDGKTTYQTLPNSNFRDYRAPAHVTEGNTTFQTLPNSNIRDYRAPAHVTKGNTTYQTLTSSTTRDYRVPAYVSGKGKK